MDSKRAEALGEEKLLGPPGPMNEAPPPQYQPQPTPYPTQMYPDQAYTAPNQGYAPAGYAPAGYAPAGYAPSGYVVSSQPVTIHCEQEPLEPVPDYLCLSIFNTLCCCLCLGIAAIVTSSQANSMRYSNNRLAAEKARTAKNLNIAGLVCGIIIIIIYVVLRFAVRRY